MAKTKSKTREQAQQWLLAIIICALIIGVIYGMYLAGRWLQYNFGYESQVRSTVCEMVKPEYLKEPCE